MVSRTALAAHSRSCIFKLRLFSFHLNRIILSIFLLSTSGQEKWGSTNRVVAPWTSGSSLYGDRSLPWRDRFETQWLYVIAAIVSFGEPNRCISMSIYLIHRVIRWLHCQTIQLLSFIILSLKWLFINAAALNHFLLEFSDVLVLGLIKNIFIGRLSYKNLAGNHMWKSSHFSIKLKMLP